MCNRIGFASLASATVLASLAGCVDDGTAPPDDQEIGSVARTIGEFTWDQYQGYPTRLIQATDGFCYLTRIGGFYAGIGEQIELKVVDGWWYLDGTSQQSAVSASARCARWTDFSAPPSHSVSDMASSLAWSREGSYHPSHVALWDFRSFCYLTGLDGKMNGQGESAAVVPGYGAWDLYAQNGTGGLLNYSTEGRARCVWLGQQAEVAYVGGNPQSLGEFAWSQGQQPVTMATTATADCFLTGVQGKFAGSGESVTITIQNGAWVLGGTSQQSGVGARARCVALNQNIPGQLFDGGFENDPSPQPQTPWVKEGSSLWALEFAGVAHTGIQNARVFEAFGGWNALSQRVTVTPNTWYTFSGWVKSYQLAGWGFFGVRASDGSVLDQVTYGADRICGFGNRQVACESDWTPLAVTVFSGSNTVLAPFVGFWSSQLAASVRIDDLTLTH